MEDKSSKNRAIISFIKKLISIRNRKREKNLKGNEEVNVKVERKI